MNLNILTGLNEDVSPASIAHKDGALSVCKNMRVSKTGIWSPVTPTLVSGNDLSTVIADDGNEQTTTTIQQGIDANGSVSVATYAQAGSRMQTGLYFYIATTSVNGSEGVTSKAQEYYVGRNFNGNDVRENDVPVITAEGDTPRIYRTKVIYAAKGSKLQRVQVNSPTEFFYVGSGNTVYDYLHDSELGYKYEGRGSELSSAPAVIARFDGRIFAFYTGYARWSSVGRPREFPQVHTVVFHCDYSDSTWSGGDYKEKLEAVSGTKKTVSLYPTLENGVQAETRLWMPEILTDAVTTAVEFKGKLWVWTATTVGYITPSGAGYRYVHLSEHFGGIADTIVEGGASLYGCDSNGAWALDGNYPKKISEGIITPTGIDRGNWNSTYDEYWFGSSTKQYIYNSRLGTITSYVESGTPAMTFWVQADVGQVKEDLRVTILLKTGACTAVVWQGYYPATAACVSSGSYTIADGTYVTTIEPINSGRFTGIVLTGTSFELAGISIEAKGINEVERNYR
jgi:hypothetical protein